MKLFIQILRLPLISHLARGLFHVSCWIASLAGLFRPLDRLLGRWARELVKFYRLHLSAHKGYKCAYALATGGPTCSTFAMEAFGQHGIAGAMREMTLQFGRCKQAKINLGYDKGLIGEALSNATVAYSQVPPDPVKKTDDGGCCGC